MKILFVCKGNRFRSKVAEAIFNKLSKNNNIKAESGGIQLDKQRPYIEKSVIRIMKEKGYVIKGKPIKLHKNWKDFGLIIIVANNVPKKIFKDFEGRVTKWNIPDCDASDKKKIKEIITSIELKVRGIAGNNLRLSF